MGTQGTSCRGGWKCRDSCWDEGSYMHHVSSASVCCPFPRRRSSICPPHPSIPLMLLPVLSPSLCPPPLHCSFCIHQDWLTVPSHGTRAARVPLCWKLDTRHLSHLRPTSPTTRTSLKKKPSHESVHACKRECMEIQ